MPSGRFWLYDQSSSCRVKQHDHDFVATVSGSNNSSFLMMAQLLKIRIRQLKIFYSCDIVQSCQIGSTWESQLRLCNEYCRTARGVKQRLPLLNWLYPVTLQVVKLRNAFRSQFPLCEWRQASDIALTRLFHSPVAPGAHAHEWHALHTLSAPGFGKTTDTRPWATRHPSVLYCFHYMKLINYLQTPECEWLISMAWWQASLAADSQRFHRSCAKRTVAQSSLLRSTLSIAQ